MSINDSQPGKAPTIMHGNGDPQGPLRAGPWGERQAWDHERQRWVTIRPGRQPIRAHRMEPVAEPPDDEHEAKKGHSPLWGEDARHHRICHECRRIVVANWRAKRKDTAA